MEGDTQDNLFSNFSLALWKKFIGTYAMFNNTPGGRVRHHENECFGISCCKHGTGF